MRPPNWWRRAAPAWSSRPGSAPWWTRSSRASTARPPHGAARRTASRVPVPQELARCLLAAYGEALSWSLPRRACPMTAVGVDRGIAFAACEIVPEARRAALAVLESGWVTTGPLTPQFERAFAAWCRRRRRRGREFVHGRAWSSSLRALRLPPGTSGAQPDADVLRRGARDRARRAAGRCWWTSTPTPWCPGSRRVAAATRGVGGARRRCWSATSAASRWSDSARAGRRGRPARSSASSRTPPTGIGGHGGTGPAGPGERGTCSASMRRRT